MKKSSMHGKIMEIEKNLIIMETSWNFVKLYDETNSSQKTSCQSHTKLVGLTASFLATGGFNLHGEDVTMLLKGEHLK